MITVLIADDEHIIRTGLESYVNSQNLGMHVVASAKDGIDAYEKTLQLRPDIILTDINMPRCDGLDFIAKVNEIENYSPEFIILTGFGEFEYAKSAVELGVSAFLLKPINMTTLVEYLKKAEEKTLNKQKLENKLSDYYAGLPYLQNLFFINLFTGKISDCEDIKRRFEEYRIMQKKYFSIAVIDLNNISDSLVSENYSPPKNTSCYFCSVNNRQFCILLFSETAEHDAAYKSLENLSDKLNSLTSSCIKIGISNFYTENNFYSIAYYEALEALNLTDEHRNIIFYDAAKESVSFSHPVQSAVNIIVRDYAKQISINEVADELRVSPSHIMHIFKQETGMTFLQYLTDYRIQIAIKMLETKNYKIYEIADSVGYRDTKHFTKIFKKETGRSPSDYLKK